MIKRRRLKKFVVPMIYVCSLAMLITSIYFVERIVNNTLFKSNKIQEVEDVVNDDDMVDSTDDIPVVNTEPQIIRPYTNGNVKLVKSFYDYQSDRKEQEESILYYGDTYMQNSGVDYATDGEFEVVSVLDGTVTEVVEDEVMGKTIKITHSNDLVSVYQSMGTVDVKVNDSITQGMIIGKSGTNNISSDLGNHLHFELYHKGSVVNPENYFGKMLGELG